MKKIIHFIGIDVSKDTFDLALIKNNDPGQIMQKLFSNNITGFKNLTVWMKQQMVCYEDTVFCIEHTGYYSKPLAKFIQARKGNLWMEMSLKIIRSLGIQTGKNDKIDVRRIAQFAQRNQQDYKPYNSPRVIIEKLKLLLMLRQKLIDNRTSIVVPVKELQYTDKQAGKEALRIVSAYLKAIKKYYWCRQKDRRSYCC